MRQITESESTPKADGFYMPAEFAPQDRVFMGWPNRPDTFAFGAVPAQRTYAGIANAISEFTPVVMCCNEADYDNCKAVFKDNDVSYTHLYGLKRKAEIGEDKVFDYSIGNPSVPAPQKVADTIEELMKLPPVELHAYSPAAGIPAVRQTIADSIARRYGIPAKAGRVYMTVGCLLYTSRCV